MFASNSRVTVACILSICFASAAYGSDDPLRPIPRPAGTGRFQVPPGCTAFVRFAVNASWEHRIELSGPDGRVLAERGNFSPSLEPFCVPAAPGARTFQVHDWHKRSGPDGSQPWHPSTKIRTSGAAGQTCIVFEDGADKDFDDAVVEVILLPAKVDLREWFTRWNLPAVGQGNRNTCSVFTTTAAIEFALAKSRNRGERLSVEYLNWACNQITGNRQDVGQFFHNLQAGFEKFGICAEADMPYRAAYNPADVPGAAARKRAEALRTAGLRFNWIQKIQPRPGLSDAHLAEIKAVLATGFPVAAGASHSRLIVGYEDNPALAGGGRFFTKDSGSGRFDEVTFQFAKTQMSDLFWVAFHCGERAPIGPDPPADASRRPQDFSADRFGPVSSARRCRNTASCGGVLHLGAHRGRHARWKPGDAPPGNDHLTPPQGPV